jgi:mannose-6-phosphate isomerase-like protein (cupin superfamily)
MEEKQNIYDLASHLGESFRRVFVGLVDEYVAFLVRIAGSYLFHQHPKDELYIVLDGELAVDFDGGETVVLKKGDSLVARAGQKHRSRSDEGAVALIFKAVDILSNEERIVESRTRR